MDREATMTALAQKKQDGRYLLLESAAVRNGLAGVKPGWLMGTFVDERDLRFSQEFELKEWDLRSMRRNWRDGTDCGSEYIAVLDGTLTVILGRVGRDGSTIEAQREIELRADQRIIIAPGVWRTFRATKNVKAITVRHCHR
jgi:hypothetical protein